MDREIPKEQVCNKCLDATLHFKKIANLNSITTQNDKSIYESFHDYHMRAIKSDKTYHDNFKLYGVVLDPSNPKFEEWKAESGRHFK